MSSKECIREKEQMRDELNRLWERIVQMQDDIWRLKNEKKMD